MNAIIWICAGAAVGWAACAWLGWNSRGPLVSVSLGAVAALIGGHLLAPVLGAAVPELAGIRIAALFVAIGSATASLKIADLVNHSWRG